MLDVILAEQSAFWMRLLTSVSNRANITLAEMNRMDVFDFFALMGVVEQMKDGNKN